MTLSDQLDNSDGRPSGFDYLRIVLSIAVIAWHGLIVCYGRGSEDWFWTGPLRPLIFSIIPCFFALSGFLVASSLERNDLPSFLTLRFIRIFPALVVEVFFSALVIGPLVTTMTLADYFTQPDFYRYFQNTLGLIHYDLPGVFAGLPAGNAVNIQLWTVPFELECYILIFILALMGLSSRAKLFFYASLGILIAYFLQRSLIGPNFVLNYRPDGRFIVICFLFGAAFYFLRSKIKFSIVYFVIAAALSWVMVSFVQTIVLAALPLAYVTVYIGLLNPGRNILIKSSDYSYGIYLYGFPFQQLLAYVFPEYRVWWFNVGGAILLTGLLAALSWHFIESPILRRKRYFLKVVNRCVPGFLVMPLSRHRTKGAAAVGRTFTSKVES